ncbi:MAG: hypothetical protein M1537_02715 [Nitrospirae bacterium]|nr:MAG: hypothetical protein D084_Lepto4C00305G0002 [Leptospirillum sp. Group IV 'UBA BS']MCL4485244.1 hypothetical protein [Nitrospirota bacterium]
MNLPARVLLLACLLVLAISGLRWFPYLSAGINPVPMFLFFLLRKREKYDFFVLGVLAGLVASLVSYGPGSFWVLLYVSEAWVISRLSDFSTRSGVRPYFLVWIVLGIDMGAGLLLRKLLDFPLETQLLRDWLVMDGVTGLLGMVLVFVWQSLGGTADPRSRKQHGIGIPLS